MALTTYEVVTSQVTVLATNEGNTQEFRVAAPTGKRPLSGSYMDVFFGDAFGSYPDGDEWVFRFYGRPSARTVDLYVVCASAL